MAPRTRIRTDKVCRGAGTAASGGAALVGTVVLFSAVDDEWFPGAAVLGTGPGGGDGAATVDGDTAGPPAEEGSFAVTNHPAPPRFCVIEPPVFSASPPDP